MSQNVEHIRVPSYRASDTRHFDDVSVPKGARIAAYDDLLSAPRIIEIPSLPIQDFIEALASKTYELSQSLGGNIPYTVIREVSENLIHANFKEPVVSIFDMGNTVTFSDQGPGVDDKIKAQLPGFTSATGDMKRYIKGVGSGLPIVKEYLSVSGGQLKIEDNLNAGTIVTVSLVNKNDRTAAVPGNSSSNDFHGNTFSDGSFETDKHLSSIEGNRVGTPSSTQKTISNREDMIMELFLNHDEIGQTDIKKLLGISIGTSTRTLESLESAGYLVSNSSRKRVLTKEGFEYLKKVYGASANRMNHDGR